MAEKETTKRAANFKDLTGQRFGRWTVLHFQDTARKMTRWACRCDCGREVIVLGNSLRRRLSVSCGCSRWKHGRRTVNEYKAWHAARSRCTNPSNEHWAEYGGRGITMCERWQQSFDEFFRDMGPRPDGLSLDRIDNDGPYSPENCRWASQLTQQSNRRTTLTATHNGETLTIKEWARRSGERYRTLLYRIENGLPLLERRRKRRF